MGLNRATLMAGIMVGLLGASLEASAQTEAEAPTQEQAALAAGITQRAAEAYGQGEFARAALLLREALDLHPTPALHYNLGRTLTELSDWEGARDQLRRYLELAPQSENRAAVEARLAELDRRIAAAAEAEISADPGDATNLAETADTDEGEDGEESDAPDRPSPAPWVVLGGGVVVAGAGVPFALLSARAVDDARAATTQLEAVGPRDDARRHARLANTFFAIGGTLALAGLIWGLVRGDDDDDDVTFEGDHLRVRF